MDSFMSRTTGRGRRLMGWAGLCLLALTGTLSAADDWKLDVLTLKNGAVFKGLLVEETAEHVRFRNVRRSLGQPTVVIPTATFQRAEIAGLLKLADADRQTLKERLQLLDPSGKLEEQHMENLDLKPAPWVVQGGDGALRYASVHFVLLSNAREDIVRRSAVRLEQIYGAYTRFLPPRHQAGKPTAIILVRSLTEYGAFNKDLGRTLLNPAYFEPARNRIVCASDLEQLGEDLERVRKKHQQFLDQLRAQEAEFKKKLKVLPAPISGNLHAKRQEILRANHKNDQIFATATKQLFQTLYHEAFHAYLTNYVYTAEEAEVPRWLNEGLAQVFETSLIEAGELRVGHVDHHRLGIIRAAARKKELVPLPDLLRSGPKHFLVAHASDKQLSDRYYLSAWALASYLAFDRGLLGTPALHTYVQSLKRAPDNQIDAFRILVGKPLSQFEKDYQHYLENLRSDGTAKK